MIFDRSVRATSSVTMISIKHHHGDNDIAHDLYLQPVPRYRRAGLTDRRTRKINKSDL